jgi:hypothetical protein
MERLFEDDNVSSSEKHSQYNIQLIVSTESFKISVSSQVGTH